MTEWNESYRRSRTQYRIDTLRADGTRAGSHWPAHVDLQDVLDLADTKLKELHELGLDWHVDIHEVRPWDEAGASWLVPDEGERLIYLDGEIHRCGACWAPIPFGEEVEAWQNGDELSDTYTEGAYRRVFHKNHRPTEGSFADDLSIFERLPKLPNGKHQDDLLIAAYRRGSKKLDDVIEEADRYTAITGNDYVVRNGLGETLWEPLKPDIEGVYDFPLFEGDGYENGWGDEAYC